MSTLWIFEYDALDIANYPHADDVCEQLISEGDHISIVGNADKQMSIFEQAVSYRALSIRAKSFLIAPPIGQGEIAKYLDTEDPSTLFHPGDAKPLPAPDMLYTLIEKSPSVERAIFIVHDINYLVAATMAGIQGETAMIFYMMAEAMKRINPWIEK